MRLHNPPLPLATVGPLGLDLRARRSLLTDASFRGDVADAVRRQVGEISLRIDEIEALRSQQMEALRGEQRHLLAWLRRQHASARPAVRGVQRQGGNHVN